MRLFVMILAICAACSAQDPNYTKKCDTPADNVYRDGHCEMYRTCDWSGPKYRAIGRCFKVIIDAPEKSIKDVSAEPSHRRIIDICDDNSRKPRSCKKEFDERGEDYNTEDCLDRRREMHQQKFYETHCPREGGMCSGDSKEYMDQMLSLDRYLAARECTAKHGGEDSQP